MTDLHLAFTVPVSNYPLCREPGFLFIKKRTWKDMAHEVAAVYGVTYADLIGPSRLRKYVWPRQHLMVLMRDAGHSYPRIGMWLGNRHHCTIMAGCKAHAARLEAEGA